MASAPEAAETMAYTRYVLDRGMAGDLLDLHVALAPCIVGYAEIGAAMGTAADDHPYQAWIEMYASDDYQQVAADEICLLDSQRVQQTEDVVAHHVPGLHHHRAAGLAAEAPVVDDYAVLLGQGLNHRSVAAGHAL